MARRITAEEVADQIQEEAANRDSESSEEEEQNGTRKRLVNMEERQVRIKSRRYNTGEAKTWMGTVAPRTPQGTCVTEEKPNGCPKNCSQLLTAAQQQELCTSFWKQQPTRELRYAYIDRTVQKKGVGRRRRGVEPRKQQTFVYSLHPRDAEKIEVCKMTYCRTFNISSKMVQNAKSAFNAEGHRLPQGPERRGGGRRYSARTVANVRAHIRSFPKVPSHYCRKNTKKQYLSDQLTTKQMWRLYMFRHRGTDLAISLYSYRRIFNRRFNMAFHKPKKDRCKRCVRHDLATDESPEDLEAYTTHRKEADLVQEQKRDAKRAARENPKLSAICFDLQQVMTLPRSHIGETYYLQKLNNYNLTVWDLATKQAHCYLWHEGQIGRGASDIALAVVTHLEMLEQTTDTETVLMFSDSAGSQNRNRIMSAALIHFLTRSAKIKTIIHKYFVPGHSMMEADNVHSHISTKLKHMSADHHRVYVPSRLHDVIRSAAIEREYIVKELAARVWRDYAELEKRLMKADWQRGIRSMRAMKYTMGDSGMVKLHWTESVHESEEDWNEVAWRKPGRSSRMPLALEVGAEPIGIDSRKHEELRRQADILDMAEDQVAFYENLKVKRAPASRAPARVSRPEDTNPSQQSSQPDSQPSTSTGARLSSRSIRARVVIADSDSD